MVKILLVTPVSPFTWASGSQQRSGLMLEALRLFGEVDILQLAHGSVTQAVKVQEAGHWKVEATVKGADWTWSRYRPKPEVTRLIESSLGCDLGQYALIVGRYVWPVCQLVVPETTPVIVDLDDFCYRVEKDAPVSLLAAKDGLLKRIAAYGMRRQLGRFSAAFFASAMDQREAPPIASSVLPNIPNWRAVPHKATSKLPPPQSLSADRAGPTVLFVGSLWYRPNAGGVNWFLNAVWPTILAQIPDANLVLAGAAPELARKTWERHPNVTAPGFVDDLAQAYANANLVVVPLLAGGGTNIKILEAMAFERPCLVTRFCHAVFAEQFEKGVDLYVADSASDFAAKAVVCLKSPQIQGQIAKSGRLAVERFFSEDQFNAVVQATVSRVLAESSAAASRSACVAS